MAGDRRPGRPRSETARGAILAAATAELRERGFAGLTIEGIAARAGTGKQTIYRWWRSKADVVLDAVLDQAATLVGDPDEGLLLADLRGFVGATFAAFRPPGHREVLASLMAQAVLDPQFGRAFRERFLFNRRDTLRAILARGRERGEIDPTVDLNLLIDVVYGVLWYRLLVDHAPLDDESGKHVADLVARLSSHPDQTCDRESH